MIHLPSDLRDSYMEELHHGIEDLPKDYRKVWEYHHVYLFTDKEISYMFDVPLYTVKKIIEESRVLTRLY